MQWNDYKPMFKAMEQINNYKGTPTQVVDHIINKTNISSKYTPRVWANHSSILLAEACWTENRRPYYNLYPSVIKAFTKVDLSKITCSMIKLPLQQLVIRFPVGSELGGVKCFMVSYVNSSTTTGILIAIDDGNYTTIDNIKSPQLAVHGLIFHPNDSIEHRLKIINDNHLNDKINQEMIDNCYRILIAVCLLGDNTDLIERAPLESDKVKWEATHDIKLIEKAERRGKREWNVGSKVEIIPGFRNPYFAIRWMGRGVEEKNPVLRPISGYFVNRKSIVEVPTGYLDDQFTVPTTQQ